MSRHRSLPVIAALGVIWFSASSDFGTRGVLNCFGQFAPKVPVVAAADFRLRTGEYGIKLDHSYMF